MIRIDFEIGSFSIVFKRGSKRKPAWKVPNRIKAKLSQFVLENPDTQEMNRHATLEEIFPGQISDDKGKQRATISSLSHAIRISALAIALEEIISGLECIYGEKPYDAEIRNRAISNIKVALSSVDLPVIQNPSVKKMYGIIRKELSVDVRQRKFALKPVHITVTIRRDQKPFQKLQT